MRLLDRIFRLEEINCGDRCPTYLYRWTLFQPRRPKRLWNGFGIYLHKFVGDDWSLDLHDHPKRFVSIGLRGAYVEETPNRIFHEFEPGRYLPESCAVCGWWAGGTVMHERTVDRVYRAPWIRTFPAEHVHRLRLLGDRKPCWTLVVVLCHVREWGFHHEGTFIPWREYVKGGSSWIADKMRSCL